MCTSDAIGPYKPLLVAVDDMAYHYMLALDIPARRSIDFGVPLGPSAPQNWNSTDYVALCRTRINMVLHLLESGLNVFFADMDIVWLGDPLQDLVEGVSPASPS
jgi:hypothetical protein